jgi:outer membrane protein assembly factor BamB
MNRKLLWLMLLLCMFSYYGCSKKENGNSSANTPPNTGAPDSQHISVLTQHNDNTRAGLNSNETALTTSNVNTSTFGKLFSLSIDDQVCAQPLVVSNVSIGTGTHNVVYIATVNNSLYAFDGDDGTLYWHKNFTISGMRPPNANDMASGWCNPYNNISFNIGIVGTPVIDSASQTIFFVSRSTDGTHFEQNLHAVNIVNGSELAGSPVTITATVTGTGDGSSGGSVSFDPMRNNQRMGLALVNGVVYISFSSHCDWNPYHGWILGYDEHTLQQVAVYNDTPDGEGGGIWESAMGIAADTQGNLYVTTGNGTAGQGNDFTPTGNGTSDNGPNPDPGNLRNRSESALKLTPSGDSLLVSSFFTPYDYYNLNNNDLDYGVMGTLLIPNSNYYFTGGKDGNIYLLDKDNMGGYSAGINQVQQTISISANMHCQPAYYKGSSKEFVYVWSENDQLRALPFNRAANAFDNSQVTSSVSGPTGQSGAELSVSSNGTKDGTGILWATYASSGDAESSTCPGIIRAFDANDITNELWDSNKVPADNLGTFAKFSPPTIADGHVYVPTFSGKVVVYGLK